MKIISSDEALTMLIELYAEGLAGMPEVGP